MRFKLGDKVRMTGKGRSWFCSDISILAGKSATVESVDEEPMARICPYYVRFESFGGYFVSPDAIEPAERAVPHVETKPKFRFGDKVRVSRDWARSGAGEDNEAECHGDVGVVLDARCPEGTYEVAFPNGDSWYIESRFLEPESDAVQLCPADACCSIGQPAEPQVETNQKCRNQSECCLNSLYPVGPSVGISDALAKELGFLSAKKPHEPESEILSNPVYAGKEGVSVASTGAVRSKDADNVRYDLITPIGLDRVAVFAKEYYEIGESCNDDDPEAIQDDVWSSWHAGAAAAKIYQFLMNDSSCLERTLSFAFLDLCWAAIGSDKDYERFCRMSAGCDFDSANFELIPPAGMEAVARAYHDGSIKYDSYNWEKGMPVWSLLNHGLRHIYLWLDGDRTEDHLGHSMWNVLAAIHSYILWPHLNAGKLREPGCKPPRKEATAC